MSLETQNWAEQEFGNADLGDYRRTKRLMQLAGQRGSQPHASFSQSCGDDAATKAAYRFYENESIHPAAILSSHYETTQTRMSQESIVLNFCRFLVGWVELTKYELLTGKFRWFARLHLDCRIPQPNLNIVQRCQELIL